MGYKRALRNILASPKMAIIRNGLHSLRKGPVVFFYHGVEKEIIDPYIQFLHVRLKEFEKAVLFLKSRYEIVSPDDLSDFINGRVKLGPDHCLLTFDDGYRNNLKLVAPCLNTFNIPFSVFISTNHIESGHRFASYYLRCCIISTNHKQLTIRQLNKNFDLSSTDKKKKSISELWQQMVRMNQREVRPVVAELMKLVPRDQLLELNETFSSEQPMTWEEVKKLKKMGVVIGSHCHDHAILNNRLTQDEVDYQLQTSKRLIEKNLGDCRYFAYPNGSYNDVSCQALNAAKKAGYRLGFTTIKADVAGENPPFLLPRIGGSTDPAMLESHMTLAPVYALKFRRWLKRFDNRNLFDIFFL